MCTLIRLVIIFSCVSIRGILVCCNHRLCTYLAPLVCLIELFSITESLAEPNRNYPNLVGTATFLHKKTGFILGTFTRNKACPYNYGIYYLIIKFLDTQKIIDRFIGLNYVLQQLQTAHSQVSCLCYKRYLYSRTPAPNCISQSFLHHLHNLLKYCR